MNRIWNKYNRENHVSPVKNGNSYTIQDKRQPESGGGALRKRTLEKSCNLPYCLVFLTYSCYYCLDILTFCINLGVI